MKLTSAAAALGLGTFSFFELTSFILLAPDGVNATKGTRNKSNNGPEEKHRGATLPEQKQVDGKDDIVTTTGLINRVGTNYGGGGADGRRLAGHDWMEDSGRRRLKSKAGKGTKASKMKSSKKSSNLEFQEVCVVPGFQITGTSDLNEGPTSELFDEECVDASTEFFSAPFCEAADPFFGCVEESGIGNYPVVFNTFGTDEIEWSLDPVEGATNGEAFCANLGVDSAPGPNKVFITEYNLDFRSEATITKFQYRFYIESCDIDGLVPTSACQNQFYLNLYMTRPGVSEFYDCRYDYVPSGLTADPDGWYTFTVDVEDPTRVVDRTYPPVGDNCPSDPIAAFTAVPKLAIGSGTACYNWALNIGDTAVNPGLTGCLDDVRVTYLTNENTMETFNYDFQSDGEDSDAEVII